MIKVIKRKEIKDQKHRKQRDTIVGTADRPRLSITRTLKHIYAQIVDDNAGKTLVAFNSMMAKANGGNITGAKAVGTELAAKAKNAHIEKVVFDRAGLKYHGRIKALADAAREAGLDF